MKFRHLAVPRSYVILRNGGKISDIPIFSNILHKEFAIRGLTFQRIVDRPFFKRELRKLRDDLSVLVGVKNGDDMIQ